MALASIVIDRWAIWAASWRRSAPAGLLELAEPVAVLLDDPEVVRGGEGGQALRQEVVAGEARGGP